MSSDLRPVTVSRLEASGPEAWTVFWPRDFAFEPGQVVALALDLQAPPRLYSLAGGNRDEEAGVLFNRVEGGLLTPPLSQVRRGDRLWVGPAGGSFRDAPGPSVWIAGGTGVAPFLSMLRSGGGEGKTLVQGARTRAEFYGQDEAVRVLGSRYHRCCSAEAGPGLYPGRLTRFLQDMVLPRARYLVCGSAGLVVDVRDLLISRGVPYADIVAEVYF